TVNVRNFGAAGNGLSDDTAAIQKAIDESKPGDTILIPAGRYHLSKPLALLSHRSYRGEKGSKLLGVSGWFSFLTPWNSAAEITIGDLIFDGAGIAFQGDNMPARRIRVTNCTFQNIIADNQNWTTHYAIFIPAGLVDSS